MTLKSREALSNKQTPTKRATSGFIRLGAWVGLPLMAIGSAHAAYVNRFTTTAPGALTFTGNTLGLSMTGFTNNPGVNHSVGAFITTNTALTDGTYPPGTTSNWTQNSSSATLDIPAGSTILYAELIWGGSFNNPTGTGATGVENVSSSLDTTISMTPPAGTAQSISPSVPTRQIGTFISGGTSPNYSWYVRSADVTALVRAAGAGVYTVGGIPGTQTETEDLANAAGWTLAVAYRNASLPPRNLTIFVGAEPANAAPAQASGFCTPSTGTVNGRALVSAIEGDAVLNGDGFLFGQTSTLNALTDTLSGPNNPVNNFFASQINSDSGALDIRGTFGSRNHDAAMATNVIGGRQGWDITNVSTGTQLSNNQTTAFAQGTTSGDGYLISSLGLQIDVISPAFPTNVKTVDRTSAVVGNTLTYTVTLTNNGSATATGVVFNDPIPAGTSFVPSSVTVDGAPVAGNPSTGISIGDIPSLASRVVRFQVIVNSVPSGGSVRNTSNWTYSYTACTASFNDTLVSNEVITTIGASAPDLSISKTHVGNFTQGQTGATYTLTVQNVGTIASTGAVTVNDALPAGLTATAIGGTGWTCTLTPLACSRSDALAAGASYPPITLTVNVGSGVSGTLTNTATVSGGGDTTPPNNSASDPTVINAVTPPPPSATAVPINAWWMLLAMGLVLTYGARRRLFALGSRS
jgi:uncharacterized repeat protein (TIGR01451 family)